MNITSSDYHLNRFCYIENEHDYRLMDNKLSATGADMHRIELLKTSAETIFPFCSDRESPDKTNHPHSMNRPEPIHNDNRYSVLNPSNSPLTSLMLEMKQEPLIPPVSEEHVFNWPSLLPGNPNKTKNPTELRGNDCESKFSYSGLKIKDEPLSQMAPEQGCISELPFQPSTSFTSKYQVEQKNEAGQLQLIKREAGETEDSRFFCPLIDCVSVGSHNLSFSSSVNWMDHLVGSHGDGYSLYKRTYKKKL